ncbi:hypothetical protein niasHS_010848 [Heterodera schachtii]|uniref:Uncharacterized protein n=1 Tax=Heterodera schachtii TaxID=97005 RepID=A0ABD2IUP9_HETSC
MFLLLFASFASNLILLAKRIDGFSANVHQSLVVQLSALSQQQQRKGTENENGKGKGEKKISGERERVVRHQQQQKRKTKRTKCDRLSETQKYAKLERVGGRNQIFLAASPREAGRNFPALMPKKGDRWGGNAEEEPTAEMPFMDFSLQMDDDGPPIGASLAAGQPQIVEECDEQCHEIERKLNDVVEKNWQMAKAREAKGSVFLMDDDAEEETGQTEDESDGGATDANWATAPRGRGGGETQRIRRNGCHLERFVPIGNCTKHGFEEAMGDEKLCTACQGIYVLNRECFPMFVNSVVCDRREFECIYDRFSGGAQGKCRPKVLSFKVMRNRGIGEECEQWGFEYIEVPVACECYLSKRSMWLEAVPPSMGDEHLL